MKVTYKWLQDYVDLDISAQELADRLTMVGLEVDELADRYAYLDHVLVARVATVDPHPQSDHLKICRVETGRDVFQVVCGAPNVAPGMHAPLALVGAELPGGMKVGETEIRGVRSVGMLCSEFELVVGPDASGLMALPESTPVGRPLKAALGLEDWVYEIGVTPNRPDCLCVLGLARETAGLLGRALRYPSFDITESERRIADQTSVTILSPDRCHRYVARVINDVKIAPSPFWLVDRLAGVGLRSISNVVDITNFVMMELGQPLHAFDMDYLDERRIVVKTAQDGQRFVTLDGTERILTSEMLMICDGRKPVGVAGVMGGLNSEIVPETTTVLLESAYFWPIGIRRTSKALGLSTESSFRFERGIDPDGCLFAANRASALIGDLAGGRVAGGVIDEHPNPYRKAVVPFNPTRCNAFLGTDFEPKRLRAVLDGIQLDVRETQPEAWEVEIPSFRVDLTREVDLFEEAARLIGYDRIPDTIPAARAKAEPFEADRVLRDQVRTLLEGLGLAEIVTYSFISENFCDRLRLPADDERRQTIRILNPLSEDQVLMRTTLVPGLLDALRRNQSYRVWDVGLFEIGNTFFRRENQELADERPFAAGALSGSRSDLSWHDKPQPVDFYDVKGVVEDLLAGLHVPPPLYSPKNQPAYYDRSASATISVDGRTLGWVGRLKGQAADACDLRGAPYIFELDLAAVLAVRKGVPRFSALPRFPLVERDLAVVLERAVPAGEVLEFIQGLDVEYLTQTTLFDAYEGAQVGDGRKSLAFRVVYRAADRTLTDDEVNALHQRVTNAVLENFSAMLRA